jgi:hypothetical protein
VLDTKTKELKEKTEGSIFHPLATEYASLTKFQVLLFFWKRKKVFSHLFVFIFLSSVVPAERTSRKNRRFESHQRKHQVGKEFLLFVCVNVVFFLFALESESPSTFNGVFQRKSSCEKKPVLNEKRESKTERMMKMMKMMERTWERKKKRRR